MAVGVVETSIHRGNKGRDSGSQQDSHVHLAIGHCRPRLTVYPSTLTLVPVDNCISPDSAAVPGHHELAHYTGRGTQLIYK